jgi:parvulin-like peptidyl-prolyl isomerase
MPSDQGKKPVVHTKKHIARLERERRQTRLILYTFIGILVIVVGLLLYGFLDINYFQINRPVAKVGESEISLKQLEARIRLRRQQLLSDYNLYQQYAQFGMDVTQQIQQIESQLNTPVQIGESVLDQMIDEELIRQEAAERGITLSQEDLDNAIQEVFQYFPNGTPTPSVTPTEVVMPTIPAQAFEIVTITPTPTLTPEITASPEFTATPELSVSPASTGTVELVPTATATLAPTATLTPTLEPTPTAGPTGTTTPTATPYTLESYQADYELTLERFSNLGFSEEDYRKLFETQILRTKLMDAITADVPHSEEQIWARHILVEDEATAQDVLNRLKAGEDFGEVAKEVSQDPGSGINGGDLGWFGKGAMVAPFEEAAFKLNPGEISDPVQSDFGYHIIQVIAKQGRPYTADQYEAKRSSAFTDWLTTAREEYGVETFDFWKDRAPTEPNFITMATDSANAANTAQAEEATKAAEATSTPTP